MSITVGLCQCGCGGKTRIPAKNNLGKGEIKGVAMRYIKGHNRKGCRTVGSLRWLEENDPAALRAYRRVRSRQRHSANPQERKQSRARYRARYPEKIREYSALYLRSNKIHCPTCGGDMDGQKRQRSTMCVSCYALTNVLIGRRGWATREEMSEFIKTVTQGEPEIWQQWSNAITRRKAIKPLQKLLNSQKATQRSQISEKNR